MAGETARPTLAQVIDSACGAGGFACVRASSGTFTTGSKRTVNASALYLKIKTGAGLEGVYGPIDKAACKKLYEELKQTWRNFRRPLPKVYADEFARKVVERKAPNAKGELSEFRNYDLD